MVSLEDLQKKWNNSDKINVVKGDGGLIKVILTTEKSSLEVYLLGATITSFKVANRDIIFTSKQSKFEPLKAIRGGVPIIFPQFGPGKMQQHGFARNVDWDIGFTNVNENGTQLGLSIKENEYTKKVWQDEDIKFQTTFVINLQHDRLQILFETKNTGEKTFDFQVALHTYYQISDIYKVHVQGLKGVEYIDKTKQLQLVKEASDQIEVRQEVDRVYKSCTNNPIELIDLGSQSKVTLLSPDSSFKDVVLWNPWTEKAKQMADFGDNEYLNMICIEFGNIEKPIQLAPSQIFTGNHTIITSSIQSSNL